MSDQLEEYILDHIEPEPDYLHQLWRATHVHTIHGHMTSGHLQGRLLKMLVEMIKPQHVLEVGTFSGYSALCIAEGLSTVHHFNISTFQHFNLSTFPPHLWTFEINDEMEEFTRPWIENSPYADYITFIIGDAIMEAPRLGITFDLAFLDGDKRTYVETYECVKKLMRPDGFIIVDNTLWDGHIVDPDYQRDHQTEGIRRFNDHIATDPHAEKVILPLRDGLTLIRLIP